MSQAMGFWLIEGVTEDGARFRPSDWAERLAATAATFGPDRRLRFSPTLRPLAIRGGKALAVAESLRLDAPELWDLVAAFARSNRLRGEELASIR